MTTILLNVVAVFFVIGVACSVIETGKRIVLKLMKHWLGLIEIGIAIFSLPFGLECFTLVMTIILGLNLILFARRKYQKSKRLLSEYKNQKRSNTKSAGNQTKHKKIIKDLFWDFLAFVQKHSILVAVATGVAIIFIISILL